MLYINSKQLTQGLDFRKKITCHNLIAKIYYFYFLFFWMYTIESCHDSTYKGILIVQIDSLVTKCELIL